jgi:hypothetical protein
VGASVTTSRSSGGLLLAAVLAGEHVPPTWADVELPGGLTICVATDALRAAIAESSTPIRLPASYSETIAICRALGCLPPTAAISDAIWAASAVHVAPHGLVFSDADARQMATVAWSIKHHEKIEALIIDAPAGALVADVGKDWILDNALAVRGAVNYGWRADAHHLLQPLGDMHNAVHWDYSQVFRAVKREARLNGEAVDLLDVLVARGLAARWAAAYR